MRATKLIELDFFKNYRFIVFSKYWKNEIKKDGSNNPIGRQVKYNKPSDGIFFAINTNDLHIVGYLQDNENVEKYFSRLFHERYYNRNIEINEISDGYIINFNDGICISSERYLLKKDALDCIIDEYKKWYDDFKKNDSFVININFEEVLKND